MDNPELLARVVAARLRETGNPLRLEALALALKLGVSSARVDFNGSGDSGDTNKPDLFRPSTAEEKKERQDKYLYVNDESLIWPERCKYSSDGRYESESNPEWTPEHQRLSDLIAKIAGEFIDACDTDWWNNDGGGGHVKFDLTTGECEFYVYQNETIATNESTEDFNLLNLEDEEE